MEARVQQALKLVESKKKNTVPWKLDQPCNQPCYTYNHSSHHRNGEWSVVSQESEVPDLSKSPSPLTKLALYSWNIDFMLPFPDSRMRQAVRHLQHLTEGHAAGAATVIFLAECVESDLKLIAADEWVQANFVMTDLDGAYWQSGHYGTTTLVDRRLAIKECFRVHYSQTRFERDGLFVDIWVVGKDKPVRLCNTHLESLALDPPYRPAQMQVCAQYMRDASVEGAVLAGDLNAIQDFDKRLHSDNGLKDAYLELGGSDHDAISGHTWGQQTSTSLRERFGTSRMDKVFFRGGVQLKSFARFGMGVEVEDEGERSDLVKLGFDRPWITDHLGVMAVFDL